MNSQMPTLSITPTTHIAPDNDVVTAEIFIAAPRERIFEALTDPQQAVRWWGQSSNYRFSKFHMDVRVGGKWSSSGRSEKMGDNITVEGEFLEIDPPRRLAYTWLSSWMPVITKVFWELESQDKGTVVKLTHTGFAGNADMAKGHSIGWSLVLGWLQAFSEKGETVNSRG
jgi:uncharacterized protein YndB with AHSA1/START domain